MLLKQIADIMEHLLGTHLCAKLYVYTFIPTYLPTYLNMYSYIHMFIIFSFKLHNNPVR